MLFVGVAHSMFLIPAHIRLLCQLNMSQPTDPTARAVALFLRIALNPGSPKVLK